MHLNTVNIPVMGSAALGVVPPVFMGQPASDARNITTLPPVGGGGGAGPKADLMIESIIAGPHGFQLDDIFNTISLSRGDNVPVTIPDLYAANADRTLTSGGVLYSLVDLNIFLANPPVTSLGDTFQVVNGQVAGLPGMFFSTTPFTFDSNTGFSDPAYTGNAIEETNHVLTSTPEPSAWLLLASGMAGLVAWRQKLLRKTNG